MIKLIASDVDGTLIRKGMKTCDPRLFDQIKRLKDHGILFVAASGRPYDNLRDMFEPVKDDIAYISESGPIGMYQGEKYYDKPLDPAAVVSMVTDIRNREGGNILFSLAETTYIETAVDTPFEHYMHDQLLYNSTLSDDVLALKGSCYKVASCNLSGNEKDSVYYKDKYAKDFTVVDSGDYWVDMIPKGVDKGTCLKALLDRLNIRPEEVLAFGDQENDMAMLKLAETAYAMHTSAPHVIEAAGNFTDCPEDIIEELLKTL